MKSPKGKELDGRLISEKATKRGWTTYDFAEHFGVSEDEFLEAIKTTFQGQSYQKICRQLEKNKKKGKTRHKGRVHKIKVMPACEQKMQIQEEEIQKEIEGEQEMTVTDILSELKEKEQQVRTELCNRESNKSSLIVRRKNLYEKLKKQKDEILKWAAQLQRVEKEVDQTIQEIQTVSESIEMLKNEIYYDNEVLENIRKEIIDLEKVSIFVYQDGEIEVEGIEQVVIPECWEDIYRDLSKEECVEDLTIKQIKMLSKTMAFLGSLGKKYEVTFEVDKVQEVFDRIVSERGGNN